MKLNRGFTLIELLVVISIIGMLSSVIFASIDSTRTKSRDARRLVDMRQLVTALELYASDNNGRYPTTGSNFAALPTPIPAWVHSYSGGVWIPGLTSQYISIVPTDPRNVHPWLSSETDRELLYYYNSDGRNYCIQVSQEGDCSRNPYFWGVWRARVLDVPTCKLRTGTGIACNY